VHQQHKFIGYFGIESFGVTGSQANSLQKQHGIGNKALDERAFGRFEAH
jgi:hypothetical protein